ncbi:VOC family protein [Eilatimonas milleporae]|uniref:Glyoxalase/bleomycin resistance protein/dioxygenase superfamily protein n=1 Tax=Eilatimonas milleporae TaxID=911205 RepID=A0A3M0CT07_9PROT|nr:VOC family protein [Eilatimonas milleporae]RMB12117.1 glyoxalase/bleomycin resistance protein/dioxygenase superfamily protein [Eilatimonas milleporae]
MFRPHPHDIPRDTPYGRVVQLAYHAPDIARMADKAAAELGAGPFYLLSHIPLARCRYRGRDAAFDHSSAYGQWGGLMIELIHQHDDEPSAVRDMFAASEHGLHHAAIFVTDLDAAVARTTGDGLACALDATTDDGTRFVMMDGRADYGMFLEFYEPTADMRRFYGFVARKAAGWDGARVLRPIDL